MAVLLLPPSAGCGVILRQLQCDESNQQQEARNRGSVLF